MIDIVDCVAEYLRVHQLIVQSVSIDQLLMRANFGNFTFSDGDDFVGRSNCRQSMRDNDCRSTLSGLKVKR